MRPDKITPAKAAATVPADALKRFATEIFARAGMSDGHAAIVADALVWANLRGVDTHGVTRIPRYVELIEVGDMNPKPSMSIRVDTPASVLIEADRAAGPVAMTWGVSEAVRKARDAGIGAAFVRGTTHTAALGYYTLAAAEQGMAAIAVSAYWPNMAYHGARRETRNACSRNLTARHFQKLNFPKAAFLFSAKQTNQRSLPIEL